MTLGRCPLSIYCSRGAPPSEVYHSLERKSHDLIPVMTDLALTVLYRGTSLIRKRFFLGPYSRPMPMALRLSEGGGGFL